MWRSYVNLLPLYLLVVLGYILQDVRAKIAPHIWCGACIGLMEDMKIQISTVAKNKKLEVGSFRIRADGTQEKKEVPYASSDLFLTDQLERICSAMHMYVETTNERTGDKIIIRKAAYDGSTASLKGIKSSDELRRSLIYSCQTIIEEYEDELLPILKAYSTKQNKIENDVCVNLTGLCTEEQVSARMWAMASAIMAGIQEKSDSQGQVAQTADEAPGNADDIKDKAPDNEATQDAGESSHKSENDAKEDIDASSGKTLSELNSKAEL